MHIPGAHNHNMQEGYQVCGSSGAMLRSVCLRDLNAPRETAHRCSVSEFRQHSDTAPLSESSRGARSREAYAHLGEPADLGMTPASVANEVYHISSK